MLLRIFFKLFAPDRKKSAKSKSYIREVTISLFLIGLTIYTKREDGTVKENAGRVNVIVQF